MGDLGLWIGLGAAGGAVFLSLVALVDFARDRQVKGRALRTIQDYDDVTVTTVRDRQLAVPLRQRVVQPGLRRIAQFAQTFTPIGVVQRLDETLVHAGITNWDGPRLLAVKLLGTGVGVAAGLVGVPLLLAVAPGGDDGGLGSLAASGTVFGAIFGIVGYYAPEWIVRGRADERSREIQRSLPDALDLMSISVTAGLGFEAAMDRVAREMQGVLGTELYRVVQEMRLGQGRGEALRGLGERTNVAELDQFVSAMVQAEQFGIPVARVLATQAEEMRIKRRQRAEEQAQKIPVKILFPLVACIFPVLFIVILGPPGITIYENLIQDR